MPEKTTNSVPPGDPAPCASNELSAHPTECIARLERTPLIAAVTRVTRDRGISEDIVQSGYLKLLTREAQGKLKGIGSLPAYAMVTVRNLAFDHQKNRKRVPVVKRFMGPSGHADDPADLVGLEQQIDRLPEKLKNVFLLCFVYGYSAEGPPPSCVSPFPGYENGSRAWSNSLIL
jgi:hypothetical protein